LVEDGLFRQSVHEDGKCCRSHFGLFAGVLEDWQQNLLDLPWLLGAQTSEGIDGLDTDNALFLFVLDDFGQLRGGCVDSGISKCAQGQHFLGGGFGIFEFVQHCLFVLLLFVR